ncbi:unnamed protein product [Knipowitschia caucasica]
MATKDMDVESQQRAPRGRCLDCCLLVSVLVLFAGVAGVAGVGFLMIHDLQRMMNLRPPPDHPLQPQLPQAAMNRGDAPERFFKMQNFAYLEATSSELKNHTMPLDVVSFLDAESVGSNFEWNPVDHSLRAKQGGSYFLYVELNVTCGWTCAAGVFRVQVGNSLSCTVDLPHSSSSEPVLRRCWTVSALATDSKLLLKMSLPHGPLPSWRLELRGSGVGMFLVG